METIETNEQTQMPCADMTSSAAGLYLRLKPVVRKVVRDTMESSGVRAYNGVWGLCPQGDPRVKPLGRGRGQSPPETERIFIING